MNPRSARRPIGGAPGVRRHNLAVVLHHLHVAGPMRRAELTDRTGLNRSTVAALVSELTALGTVTEEDSSTAGPPAGRGRPSPVVRPRPETVQVLAADIAVGRVSMARIGLGGVIVARGTRVVTDTHPAAMAALVASMSHELLASPEAGRVVGMGVSVPGVVRGADGNVRFAPNLGWQDAPLGDLLTALLPAGLPVRVANDGDLGALAEHQRGVARGVDDIVFVEGEVGVGCGVIIDGRPLVGAGGYAGELGHMTVHPSGRRCRCGARGCWETEIGAEALARALGLPGAADVSQVEAELRSGSPDLAWRLDAVAQSLGLGIANVVNLLNPSLVVLGGLLRDLYPVVATSVTRVLNGTALGAPLEQVRLAVPELGGDAVLLGAAEHAWQDVLADPVAVLS